MDVRSVTIGLPVRDLEAAVAWYRTMLELGDPMTPAEGVAEFEISGVWLQVGVDATERTGAHVVPRFGVPDAADQHRRLSGLGVDVGPLERVEGVLDYFELTDPDGNVLSIYTEYTSVPAMQYVSLDG